MFFVPSLLFNHNLHMHIRYIVGVLSQIDLLLIDIVVVFLQSLAALDIRENRRQDETRSVAAAKPQGQAARCVKEKTGAKPKIWNIKFIRIQLTISSPRTN